MLAGSVGPCSYCLAANGEARGSVDLQSQLLLQACGGNRCVRPYAILVKSLHKGRHTKVAQTSFIQLAVKACMQAPLAGVLQYSTSVLQYRHKTSELNTQTVIMLAQQALSASTASTVCGFRSSQPEGKASRGDPQKSASPSCPDASQSAASRPDGYTKVLGWLLCKMGVDLQYRNEYSSVVVHGGCAHKHIPYGRPLTSEPSCCTHTDDQVRLELLACQVYAQGRRYCANVVDTMFIILACMEKDP